MKKIILLSLAFFIASIAMEAQVDSSAHEDVKPVPENLLQLTDSGTFVPITPPKLVGQVSGIIAHHLSSTKGNGGIVYYPESSRDLPKKGKSYEVHGVVSDISGALAGAVIYLSSDFSKGFIANEVGEFTIKTKKDIEILSIHYIGYQDMKVVIGPEYQDKTIHIQLAINPEPKGPIFIKKPIIYLYPETKTEISIINHFKGELLTTYPAYNNGWKVIAEPNGKLLNLADNRNYNWLFWDGNYAFPASHYDFKEGFYVEKSDYTNFLLEKLAYIGLNDTEINDFIVYWLPILNESEESFIHFGVNDDLAGSSRLEVTPKPDTMIRLLMEYRKYDGKTKLPEQKLTSIKRAKFTLVEWGGAEIGSTEIK